MYECKECGYTKENLNQGNMCPYCNKAMVETAEKKKVKKHGFRNILISILAIAIGRFAGSYFAGNMAKNDTADSIEQELNSFEKQVEKYIPGQMTDSGYNSLYWGISFAPGEAWVEITPDELGEISREMLEAGKKSALDEMKSAGMSDKFIKRYEDTLYYRVEAGYNCVNDGIISGELLFTTFSAYGTDEESGVSEEILDEFAVELKDSKRGKTLLGTREYQYVDGIMEEGDMNIRMRIYTKSQGVMTNMIRVVYVEKYGNIVNSFESRVSRF